MQTPCSLEINIGIIAASIPTLKPLFTRANSTVFRYLHYFRTTNRHRKTSKETPASDSSDDQVHQNKLTLNTMPSAMPSSMSYYQEKARKDGTGWEDLESQVSTPPPRVEENVRSVAIL